MDSRYPSETPKGIVIDGLWENGLWEVRELNESRFQT